MRLHRRRRAAEVEEALTVIMAARRPVIIDPVEEGRHQGRREADRDAEEQQHDAKAPHPDTHRLSLAARVPVGSHTEPLPRSEEHTSELQSLMRISYAVFCLQKKTQSAHHKTCIK